jgi:hypothetical protein
MKINILTNQTTALGMYLVLKSKLIPDWSVENMNRDMTPNGMLLDVGVYSVKKINKKCNKYLILNKFTMMYIAMKYLYDFLKCEFILLLFCLLFL